jgi:hypothetical protein
MASMIRHDVDGEAIPLERSATMKKLSLKLDDLRVDTFQTAGGGAERGTLLGHGATVVGNTCSPSCPYTCGIIPATTDCPPGRLDTRNCPLCA